MDNDLAAKLKEVERLSLEIKECDSLYDRLKSCKRVSKKMNDRFMNIITGAEE